MAKKILIVEDERALSDILEEEFQKEGFEVEVAVNGLEGLTNAIEHKPDIILLDIIMPKMDGITMLKKLRADTWGAKVPVIILTNLSDATKDEVLYQEWVTDYLVKSNWKLEDLVKKVKDSLS